ncbi:hypothetical protein AMATHDRAFT_150595 [Amanita thiersii Skay4041]|uniref:BTB domain-containing protein n=1 Tax=Amanita thiersii Skay4041 TaxID=703135 RepID=A0A2A9NDH8_9AGAR|nr:hypothetical protein AMATHDRAFT_150595 [Amanita thiersii Skay4041]
MTITPPAADVDASDTTPFADDKLHASETHIDNDVQVDSIIRNQEFWFEDGSVVIIVGGQCFRVHQSILSRHSEVFNAMFSIPQPRYQEMLDGCPLVRLSDELSDFVDLLRVLYQPFYFDKLSEDADLNTLITFISGILRMSTKYMMRIIRQKCISVLQSKFPSTIEGCDTLLASKYLYPPEAIVRAIPLARESIVPEILPWAYYISTHIPTDELLNDASLSWRDKALCLAGKERLWEAQKTLTHAFVLTFERAPGCVSMCNQVFQFATERQSWKGLEMMRKSPHPLEMYTDWGSMKTCARCRESMERQHKAGREKLWELLPGMFELGSWKELQDHQGQ